MERLKTDERKKIPEKCPICDKEFKNVYSMSSHKGHCSGKTPIKQLDGNREWAKGKNSLTDSRIKSKYTEETIFCENSPVGRDRPKKILMNEGRGTFCEECKIPNIWNEKFLVLHLDHINGKRQDHRRENLRFLCPNCHSQTTTYCGKNGGGIILEKIEELKFIEVLKTSTSISAALSKMGRRLCKKDSMHAKELIQKYNLSFVNINKKNKKLDDKPIQKNVDVKNSQYGMMWIYNLEEKQSIRIKKGSQAEYIEKGWIVGRKMKF